MGAYRTIIESLPVKHKKMWYRNWQYTSTLLLIIFVPIFLYAWYLTQKMEKGEFCHTCNFIALITILVYNALLLYPYMRERKIDGWKMSTMTNARVYTAPIFVPGYGILTVWFLYFTITYIPELTGLGLFFTAIMIIILALIIRESLEGYKMEKLVPRKYSIPDLTAELSRRLQKVFPEAMVKKSTVKIDSIKIKIKNEHTINSVGKVEITGLKPSNLETVKKIMKIVDVLG
ncbi:MAG: DinI family protein [Euryarchaeota archaeon]|nr:DinI family protein [Euryarchaeota archaeon]